MGRQVGVWIDHMKAIIVTVTETGVETRRIQSNLDKQIRFSGGSSTNPWFGSFTSSLESQHDQKLGYLLNEYYGNVLSLIGHANSVWVFGPGVAKEEFQQYIQLNQPELLNIRLETVDQKMTERQIIEKVWQHYQAKFQ